MIPPITHELGRYSTSIPSGVYDGKMWKRRENDGEHWLDTYLLCWYGPDPEPDVCRIETRRILVVA